MPKAAIYARYSSDLQTDASIEDQLRLCRLRIAREGWREGKTYSDHGISGASMMRPGIQMLMQDALAGKFEVVVAEALDRLSRDQEDIAAIFKRLSFAGVKILTLAEGEISHLHIGLKGTMNALFLKDLADKTRRGLRGRIEAGKSGGGLTYGYDVVRTIDGNSEPERGERRINRDEAEIVRRIFRDYVAGHSPRAIAVALNKEGISGPSGRDWGASTIYGNRQRGIGILNNELYIGRLIWNRQRFIKDPDTGKRVARPNPESEWVIHEVPELRIIDQDLWEAVKAKQGEINRHDTPLWRKNRPKNLFSHLLKCGCCGGGYSLVSQTHLGCSRARDKGTCDNRRTMSREKLEADILHALQARLMDPDLCAAFCEEYTKHLDELRRQRNAQRESNERELQKVKRQLTEMVDAIAEGAPVAPVRDKMNALDQRRQELEESLETAPEAPVVFHPNMAQRYHEEVQRLIESLNTPDHRAEAAAIIRSMVEKIVLTPAENGKGLTVDLIGDLAGILSVASNQDRTRVESELSVVETEKQEAMVAGVGFEPTTFRL